MYITMKKQKNHETGRKRGSILQLKKQMIKDEKGSFNSVGVDVPGRMWYIVHVNKLSQ